LQKFPVKTKICTNINFTRFFAKVINITVASDLRNSSTPKILFGPIKTVNNNGNATLTTVINDSQNITEMAEFEFPAVIKKFTYFDITDDAQLDFLTNNLAIGNSWNSLKKDLNEQLRSYKIYLDKLIYFTNSTKEFQVQKSVNVPPCTMYEISSYFNVEENTLLFYLQTEVFASQGERKILEANEIRKLLKNITFLDDINKYHVAAEIPVKLRLTSVVGSGVNATGATIRGCN